MPLFQQFKAPGDIHVALWETTEPEDELYALLDDDERNYKQQLSGLSTAKRRMEFMTVRLLTDLACGDKKEIAYTPEGAPFLVDHSFEISASHTAGCVAIALHPTQKVGIDVERFGPKVMRVKEKFLNDTELLYLQNDAVQRATILWCAKESMFKAMNSSAVDFRTQLNIFPFDLKTAGLLQAEELHTDSRQCFDIYYHMYPEFALTYCKSII